MKKHLHHIHIFLLSGLIFLGILLVAANYSLEVQALSVPINLGVSYSPDYAKSLGLNPKKTYQSILKDLKVKNLRLSAYWNEIEPGDNQFDFSNPNYYVEQAGANQAQVVLTVGLKQPRWPECRLPVWLKNKSTIQRELAQINMIRAVVTYYDHNPTIQAFQVENEPLFKFGSCPDPDPEFLKTEVNFVRTLTNKPIMVTDAGELNSWIGSMQAADIFGTTLYRVVDTPWIGIFQYPLRPWFYRVKSDLVRHFFAPDSQKTIIAELQAEPWATQPLPAVPINEQTNRYSIKEFQQTVDFAHQTGFGQAYLWGVEWWYYMAAHSHPEYLNFAKTLFTSYH